MVMATCIGACGIGLAHERVGFVGNASWPGMFSFLKILVIL